MSGGEGKVNIDAKEEAPARRGRRRRREAKEGKRVGRPRKPIGDSPWVYKECAPIKQYKTPRKPPRRFTAADEEASR